MHSYTQPSFDGNISTPEQAWQAAKHLQSLHMEREAKMQEAKKRLWRENIKDDLAFAMFKNPRRPIKSFQTLLSKEKTLCQEVVIKLALHNDPQDVFLDAEMVLGRFVQYLNGNIKDDDTADLTDDLQAIFAQNILRELPDYFIEIGQELMNEVIADKNEMLKDQAALVRGIAS